MNVRPHTRLPTLPFIDALRGLAALAVVLFHVRVDLWVGWKTLWTDPQRFSVADRWLSLLSMPTPMFGAGVMLFFVISGFCIHLPNATQRPPCWKAYAVRRLIRILPPYLAAVALSWVVEQVGLRWLGQATSPTHTTIESMLMVQNYAIPAVQMCSNPSLWSLPVEVEFYAVYPLLWIVLQYAGLWRTTALVIAVGGVASMLLLAGNTTLNLNFMRFWPVWFGGAILAHLYAGRRLALFPKHLGNAVVLLIAGLGIWGQFRGMTGPFSAWLWGSFFTLILWKLLVDTQLWNSLHRSVQDSLAWLGTISYSLYLVHFPLFHLFGGAWRKWQGDKPASFLVPMAATFLAVPAAWVFHRLVESPSQKAAVHWGRVLAGAPSTLAPAPAVVVDGRSRP